VPRGRVVTVHGDPLDPRSEVVPGSSARRDGDSVARLEQQVHEPPAEKSSAAENQDLHRATVSGLICAVAIPDIQLLRPAMSRRFAGATIAVPL
jgi:hypothetical protein